MTLIRRDTIASGSDLDVAWWRLNDAGIELGNDTDFDLTLSAAPSSPNLIVSAATYEEVDQTTPIEDSGFGDEGTGGGNPTASAVTTTLNGIVIAALNANRGTSDVSETESGSLTNMTDRQEAQSTRSYVRIADTASDGTNFTPTFTITHQSNVILSAFSLADAATAQTVEIGLAEETDAARSISTPLPQDFDGAGLVDPWRTVSSTFGDGGAMAISVATDRLLVVQTHLRSSNGGQITALTYGEQSMTLIRRASIDLDVLETGSDLDIAFWQLDEAGIVAATSEAFEITDSGDPEDIESYLNAAVYAGVLQSAPIKDNGFTTQATSGANPGSASIPTDDLGIVVASLSANRGTEDTDETEDVVWSNLTEKLEIAGALQYISLAVAPTDGTNFTPGGTITHADAARLVAFSIAAVPPVQEQAIGLVTETDSALGVTAVRAVQVGQTGETNSAQPVAFIKGTPVDVGQASETDSALGITPFQPGKVQVGQADETDAAQEIRPARALTIGIASETDTAQPVTLRREVFVGLATESDAALRLINAGVAGDGLDRRNSAGSASDVTSLEMQEAKRLGKIRRQIEQDDDEIITLLPGLVKSLLRMRRRF